MVNACCRVGDNACRFAFLGPITPLGGSLMIAGCVFFDYCAVTSLIEHYVDTFHSCSKEFAFFFKKKKGYVCVSGIIEHVGNES